MVKVDYAFSEPSAPALLADGGPVTVPDAHLLFTADFSRSGHDLLLTGDDGHKLVIVDYFGPHGPVDLVSPDGAILSSSTVQSLAGPLAPGQYAQAGDQQPAEAIGKVVTVEGSVSAQHTDGTVVQLAIGNPVAMGDVLQTGSGASVGLVFTDGTVFSLSGDSRMVLDNLVYQSGGDSNALNFSIVQGTFSFVAGQIAPTGEMRIDTPVATMGIRGTAPMGICSQGGPCKFILVPNPGDGHVGEYLLFAPGTNNLLATVNTTDLQYTVFANGGFETGTIDPDFREELQHLIDAFVHREASLDNDDGNDATGGGNVIHGGSGIDIANFSESAIADPLVDAFAAFVTSEAEEVSEAIESGTETVTTTDAGVGIVDSSSPPIITQNQPPTFGGEESGDAVEDVGTSTGGQVIVDDPDGGGQSGVQQQTATQGIYGVFSIASDGTWTYTLNNGSAAVQGLPDGAEAHDIFVVVSADGTATTFVDITVTGTNDEPTITGTATGDVGEDATGTATGVLTVSDPDTGESSVVPQTGVAGTYGTFAITAAGVWSYTLNNALAATQGLAEGQVETDSFTVVTADGTEQVVTVTIHGSNDAAVITGDVSGDVDEAPVGEGGSSTATGDLNATDVDNPATFVAQTEAAGDYGSFTVGTDGAWTYTLNNENGDVQALNTDSEPLTDSFTVVTADGTEQVVTVTIHGSNDAAVITGDVSGDVDEAPVGEGGSSTATGDLNATDVDNPATFVAQTEAAGDYGSFTVGTDGAWTYTLNNENGDVQALNTDSEPLTDSFTVVTADGTEQVVTVTIHGSNDAAVLTPAVADLTETNSPTDISTSGTLPISDADSPETFIAQSGTEGTYGSFSVGTDGAWTYTADSAHNEFAADTTYTDVFTVTTTDGTQTTVTINIEGSNDAPVANADFGSGDPVDLPSGLIARWSADGTTEDAVGNNDGVLQNGASYATGLYGEAFSFDGIDDVFVAPSTGFPVGNEDRTLSVWVKPDAFTSFEAFLAGYGTIGSSGQAYALGTSGSTVFFSQWGNAAFGPSLEAGQWYNVAVTNVGNSVTLYLDGVAVATGIMGINTPADTDFLVGARPPVNIPGILQGQVDEIQVYDRALTPQEIQAIHDFSSPNGNVLSNDTDADNGDSKSVIGVAAGASEGDVSGQVGSVVVGTYGALTLGADGTWSYALNYGDSDTQQLGQGEAATDTFTYTMTDGSGATSTTTLTLTVHGVNDAAVANEVTLPQVAEDSGSVTITAAQLLAGASDVDGNQLTVTSVSLAGENPGELVNNENGTWTYTPPENYSGDVAFNYTVSDGSLPSSSTASLHIEAVADAPTLNLGNYGFETGDVSGWSTAGQVSVVMTSDGYNPVEGDYMTVLNTDGASQATIETFLGLSPGALDAFAAQDSDAPGYQNPLSGDATSGSAAVMQIAVSAGDQVSFSYNFVTNDYMPYNDYAIVTINGAIYSQLSDVLALGNTNGNVSSTGWQTFTYTATESGILTIGIADVDIGDQVVDSRLLIDNLRVGATGTAGEDIALGISSSLVDLDGSESLSVLISGLPSGATLSAGHFDSGLGGWVLTGQELEGLSVTSLVAGEFALTVTATATESSNGDSESTTGTINLIVDPVEGNSNPSAVDDDLPLFLDLSVSPHGDPVTIAAADLLSNDSDPNEDSLTIISVSGTSQEGATVALDGNGDIVYTPPASFNSLNGHNSIADEFTYTIADGHGGTATATVHLEVSGNDGGSSFALFSVSAETTSTETDVIPVAGFNQARRDGEWRGAGDAATMQAIAAAAGIASFGPHWAQAQTPHAASDQNTALSERGDGHGWQGVSFADLGGSHDSAGNQSMLHPPAAPAEASQPSGIDHHAGNLSDIINQHFEGLSSAGDAAESDAHTWSPAGQGHDNADASSPDEPGSSRNTPQAHAVSEQHDAPADAHDGGWKGGVSTAEGTAGQFDRIVDFSNLPSFHAPLHDAGPNASSLPDLRHGGFTGIVDFSRDLLPEPHAASLPDRGGFRAEGAMMHAPVHEAIHVAVNDVIKNMAHDAEAANHHGH